MKASENPFFFRELSPDAPFCNREQAQRDLLSYARSSAAVLLYSPRRFGKTSLIRRVQNQLVADKALALYCDFFGVTDVDEVARRLAWSVYVATHKRKSLFQKAIGLLRSFRPVLKPDESGGLSVSVERVGRSLAGIELLDDTLRSLALFAEGASTLVNVAWDEFQEIADIKDDIKVEGVMRQHVQGMKASFFFVGSRRRVLLNMFNDRKRPFYQCALNYELLPIDDDAFAPFLKHRFESQGVTCAESAIMPVLQMTGGHPYYTQKWCFYLYEIAGSRVSVAQVDEAFELLLAGERPVFEAILQGLAPRQTALLRALAADPTASVFASPYIADHGLGSTGAVQGALKKLTALDLVERGSAGSAWRVGDPMFRLWLSRMGRLG